MSHEFHRATGELDFKGKAIIDLVLSEKGGRMSIGQVANLFRVDKNVVMQTIRIHARRCDGFRSTTWHGETKVEAVCGT